MRLNKSVIIGLLIIVTVMFIYGCTDKSKDNPTRPNISEEGYLVTEPFTSFSVFFSMAKDFGYIPLYIYTPPGYDFDYVSQGRPYPVLYLLTPYRSDERYYAIHGLKEVADRLISDKIIEPMIIVCVDGSSNSIFGGSFYTDSPYLGLYYTALTKDTSYNEPVSGGTWDFWALSLFGTVEEYYPTLVESKNRAISGVGMGGYGAVMTALKSGHFGSVSAINAPLDFDGDGNGGFLNYFKDVYDNSGLNNLDSSFFDPEETFILAAGAAFSPKYTAFDVDSVYVSAAQSRLTFAYHPTDSLTDDVTTLVPGYNIHVPFNDAGVIQSNIWSVWMEHNIDSMYEHESATRQQDFDTMPKLMVWSDGAKYRFNEQMQGFMHYMDANGITYQVEKFNGSHEAPGTADYNLYDLLEDILIFHNNHFAIPEELKGKP